MCMYACMHAYIHQITLHYIHTCMHASIHPSIHTYIHTYTHTHVYVHMYMTVYTPKGHRLLLNDGPSSGGTSKLVASSVTCLLPLLRELRLAKGPKFPLRNPLRALLKGSQGNTGPYWGHLRLHWEYLGLWCSPRNVL